MFPEQCEIYMTLCYEDTETKQITEQTDRDLEASIFLSFSISGVTYSLFGGHFFLF